MAIDARYNPPLCLPISLSVFHTKKQPIAFKSTAAFPLKSILKPTVPVSPVRNIPTFEETRRRTPARGPSHNDGNGEGQDQGKEGLLIDFDTPAQPSGPSGDDRANPFDSFNAASIRDEMAAVREREEKEQRERERKMILQQREARRKSMGLWLRPS